MIGCTMTVLSNRAKSDTCLEAHKNQLAGNLGDYTTDAASAVYFDNNSDYSNSGYFDSTGSDSNDDNESIGTVAYTDDNESVGTIEDVDDAESIEDTDDETVIGEIIEESGYGEEPERHSRQSSRSRRAPERFKEFTSIV